MEEEGETYLADYIASSLNDRGDVLYCMEKLPEAVKSYDKAIANYTRLMEQEGETNLASDLAISLMNRGKALRDLGELPEAVVALDKAVSICTRLVEEENETYLADDLAKILLNRGDALKELGKLPEAVADYDKAIAIFTRLVEEEGETYLGDLLMLVRRKRAEIFKWSQDQGTLDLIICFYMMNLFSSAKVVVMKQRKQKKPSKMRQSRKKAWNRAMARFRLSPEELAMARATRFTPMLMEEVATGKKVKRGAYDKLPSRPATAGQVKRVKDEIRRRYEALLTHLLQLRLGFRRNSFGAGLRIASERQT